MRALKLFILAVFSFALFSCSNILEQGNASLEICLPGSPDYDARFIDIPDSVLNQYLQGSFFEIIIEGPVYMRSVVGFGETCYFNNLKCGRYKVKISAWADDPDGLSQWNQLYCYGERDIAVMGGKNIKSIDIYALRVNNINGISGTLQVSVPVSIGDITDNKVVRSIYDGLGEGLSMLNYVQYSNASVSYKGGYKEPLNNEILQRLYNNSYKILKNGNVIYPVGNNNDSITFYVYQDDYEIEYTFYDEGYNNVLFKTRMPFGFQISY